jgi:hypothetical protein
MAELVITDTVGRDQVLASPQPVENLSNDGGTGFDHMVG